VWGGGAAGRGSARWIGEDVMRAVREVLLNGTGVRGGGGAPVPCWGGRGSTAAGARLLLETVRLFVSLSLNRACLAP
jgi:hypothetical protein